MNEDETATQDEAAPPETPAPRPSRRRSSLLLAAAGVTVALAFAGYELWRRPLHATVKSALPATTFLAVSLDMKLLRGAEWFSRLTGDDAGRLVGLANLKSLCGYDATSYVDEIDVAIPEKGDHGDFGVEMQAREHALDDKALVACAQKLATMHAPPGHAAAAPEVHDRNGFSILQQDGVARFALHPGGPYLTGRGAWLEAMIDSAAGKAPSLDTNPEHESLRRAVRKALPESSPAAIVGSALLPPEVRNQVRTEMLGETDATSAAAMDGVLGVSGVGLALGSRPQTVLPDGGVDLTEEMVDVAIELHCETAQACTEVKELIERKKTKLDSDFRVKILGLDTALSSVAAEADGKTVHVSLHFNPEKVVKAAFRFGLGGHAGVGGGPGVRQPSTPPPPGAGTGGGYAGDYPDPAPYASSTLPTIPAPRSTDKR